MDGYNIKTLKENLKADNREHESYRLI